MSYDAATGIYTSRLPALRSFPEDKSIYQFLFDGISSSPDDPLWLVDSLTGRSFTRKQAKERSDDIARALATSHGLGNDDTLTLFSGNEIDYPTTIWGSFRLGAVVSCANPSYNGSELAYQLKLVNEHHPVKVLVTHAASLATAVEAVQLAGLPESIIVLLGPLESDRKGASKFKTLDDLINVSKSKPVPAEARLKGREAKTKLAFLSFSSGTTGLPKAVAIPHIAVSANVLQFTAHWNGTTPFRKDDKVIAVLPFFHIYGLVVVLHASVWQNMAVFTLNKFTLPDFLGTIQRWKITTIYVVPPMVILLAKSDETQKYDLSSMRVGMSGAAPLTAEITTLVRAKFPNLILGQGYGMTETCTVVTVFDPTPADIPGSSAGILLPNIDARIISPEGKYLGPGEIGELISRSPSNALGYLGNAKATQETFDEEGFIHTGDEAYIREDGWVFVVDRLKELIKVSGFQVPPAELEGLLLDHNDIQDCCVIGIVDEKSGEKPKAYIALTAQARQRIEKDASQAAVITQSVQDFVKKHKVHYKWLKEVEFIDAIPKTASGKLLRKDLRVLHAKKASNNSKM